MKPMSEVFELPVVGRHMDEESIGEITNGEGSGSDFHLEDGRHWMASTEEHIAHAAHAINMFDELVRSSEMLDHLCECVLEDRESSKPLKKIAFRLMRKNTEALQKARGE